MSTTLRSRPEGRSYIAFVARDKLDNARRVAWVGTCAFATMRAFDHGPVQMPAPIRSILCCPLFLVLAACNAGSASVKDRLADERAATKAASAAVLADTETCCTGLEEAAARSPVQTLSKFSTSWSVFIGREDLVMEHEGTRTFFKRFDIPQVRDGADITVTPAVAKNYRPPGYTRGGLLCPAVYVLDAEGHETRRFEPDDSPRGFMAQDVHFRAAANERSFIVATTTKITEHTRRNDIDEFMKIAPNPSTALMLAGEVLCNWEGFVLVGYNGKLEPEAPAASE